MKEFFTKSKRLQDFLEENGVYPKKVYGEMAIYKLNNKLRGLLDTYHIRYSVFKGVF